MAKARAGANWSTRLSGSSSSTRTISPIAQTGLWFHGWTFDGRHNFARARWARGNAWITVGILDLADLATISPAVQDFLQGVLESQVDDAAASCRRHPAPGAPCSTTLPPMRRSSATAGFGYGLLKASRLGIGPAGCRDAGLRALEAVMENIDSDGTVAQRLLRHPHGPRPAVLPGHSDPADRLRPGAGDACACRRACTTSAAERSSGMTMRTILWRGARGHPGYRHGAAAQPSS